MRIVETLQQDLRHWRPFRRAGLAVVVALALAGCASTNDQAATDFDELSDPLEPVNRHIFAINQAADTLVIRPVSVAYRDIVPVPIRALVTNFLRNLRTPIIFANEVLQGDMEGAEVAASRFLINSTAGLGGLIDIAGMSKGYEFQSEDFGQTLAVWGVGDGPFLVLPLLGPSTLRDAAGIGVDIAADPFRIVAASNSAEAFSYGRTSATIVDTRVETIEPLDEIERTSIDFYAALRSLYRQSRQAQIRDGEDAEVAPVEIPVYEDLTEFNFEDIETDEGADSKAQAEQTSAVEPTAELRANTTDEREGEPTAVSAEPDAPEAVDLEPVVMLNFSALPDIEQ
jgi:phospholipid-binding lipoprotein MlaA